MLVVVVDRAIIAHFQTDIPISISDAYCCHCSTLLVPGVNCRTKIQKWIKKDPLTREQIRKLKLKSVYMAAVTTATAVASTPM